MMRAAFNLVCALFTVAATCVQVWLDDAVHQVDCWLGNSVSGWREPPSPTASSNATTAGAVNLKP